MKEDLNKPQRTFILGLGAQKSGTTWLYEYLLSSKKVAVGMKEFHIWDALTVPEFSNFLVSDEPEPALNTKQLKIRARMQKQPDLYFEYFVKLMADQNCKMAMDITPTYAALSAKTLQYIRNNFENLGVKTKVIFLMRDPLERCWSSARMENNNKFGSTRVSSQELRTYARKKQFVSRSQYHKTLQNVFSVFKDDEVYVGFYENMFEEQNLKKLSIFFDVECDLDFAKKRVFPSDKLENIDEFTLSWVANYNKNVYENIKRLYPEVAHIWRGFNYLC